MATKETKAVNTAVTKKVTEVKKTTEPVKKAETVVKKPVEPAKKVRTTPAPKAERKVEKPVKDTKATVEKKPAKATKSATKAEKPKSQGFSFVKCTLELEGKKFTEDTINGMVMDYLRKHPDIKSGKIETFINVAEKRVYFTVDGKGGAAYHVNM